MVIIQRERDRDKMINDKKLPSKHSNTQLNRSTRPCDPMQINKK